MIGIFAKKPSKIQEIKRSWSLDSTFENRAKIANFSEFRLITTLFIFIISQILINREPLPHLTPDIELLGDCDGIINQICHL